MSKSYDDFLYENYCPWCDKRYDEVNHDAGCPNPKDPPTQRGKELLDFLNIFYKVIEDDYRNSTHTR